MPKGTAPPTRGNTLAATAELLGRWTAEHGELLRAMVALNRMGEPGARAAKAVLSVPVVRRFVLSAALFESMAEADGVDALVILEPMLDVDLAAVVSDMWCFIGLAAGPVDFVSVPGTRDE